MQKKHEMDKNAEEVRDEERVLFQQCMMHETQTQRTTSNRRGNWIADTTETQNPIMEKYSRRLPTDVTLRQTGSRLRSLKKGTTANSRRGIWKCVWNLHGYIRNAWKKIKLRPASHVSRLIPKTRIFITVAAPCVASHNNEVSGEFQSTILWQNNKVPQLDVMAGSARFCLWFIGFGALILLTFAVWDCCSQSQCKQGDEYILLQCSQYAVCSWLAETAHLKVFWINDKMLIGRTTPLIAVNNIEDMKASHLCSQTSARTSKISGNVVIVIIMYAHNWNRYSRLLRRLNQGRKKGQNGGREGQKPGFWLLSQACRMRGDKLCQCKEKKRRGTKKEACNSTETEEKNEALPLQTQGQQKDYTVLYVCVDWRNEMVILWEVFFLSLKC